MTDATGELFELCDELAEKFTARARKNDSEASFPVENFADMRKAGLMGLMVPENHGGMGADFYQCPNIVARQMKPAHPIGLRPTQPADWVRCRRRDDQYRRSVAESG